MSRRGSGRMRISPHVYNDESDVDRFVARPAPPAATVNYGVRPLGSVGERGPVAFLGSDPFAPPYSSLPTIDTSALS